MRDEVFIVRIYLIFIAVSEQNMIEMSISIFTKLGFNNPRGL